jgi:hypothetical protein
VEHFELLDGNFGSRSLADFVAYLPGYGLPPQAERERIWQRYRAGRFESISRFNGHAPKMPIAVATSASHLNEASLA